MSHVVFTISNEAYMHHLLRMLTSLHKFHPHQEVYALLVNPTDESKQKLLNAHGHVTIIEENRTFANDAEEKGFLVCCRTWHIKQLMEKLEKSVFYCDADVVFLDDVSPFFEWLSEFDFAARAKRLKPKITVNAGMLWCKYTPNNLKYIDYWIKRTKKLGIKWMSDQLGFNDMVNKYRNQTKFGAFPVEYNGLRKNPRSKIIHYKGTKAKKISD